MSQPVGTAFEAYARDGRPPGVRNYVLVLPSVICSRIVADRIAERVPEARSAPHDHGCAQIGADKDQTERTFLALARTPNVAGTVVVGLGCESIQSDDVAAQLHDLGAPVRELSIQGVGGTDECVEHGAAAAEDLVKTARAAARGPADLGDLTIGVVSSDADPSTVAVADPVVGDLVRDVVDAGGRAVVAGIERLVPHVEEAVDAASGDAAGSLRSMLERHRNLPARASRVQRAAADCAFDELANAWGDLPIRDALPYGEPATHESGVALIDAPSSFEEAATGLVAAGAQLVVHVTADGIPTGHPLAPVVKVSGEADTVAALPDDIDVDATSSGASTLRDRVVSVAGGDACAAESHGLSSFAITRVGPSM